MCKPEIRDLKIAHDGPCYFTMRSYPDACSAWSVGRSWRVSLANLLRRWADKAERVNSFTLTAIGTPAVTWDDALEALSHGLSGSNKYLNDVWRERVWTTVSEDPQSILPPTKIS